MGDDYPVGSEHRVISTGGVVAVDSPVLLFFYANRQNLPIGFQPAVADKLANAQCAGQQAIAQAGR